MPRLVTSYNFGSSKENENPELTRQLSDVYTRIAIEVNLRVSRLVLTGGDPPANNEVNRNFEIGDLAVRTDTDDAWIMTSRTTDEAVTWTQIN